MKATKFNTTHIKLLVTYYLNASVVAVAIVLPFCWYRTGRKPFSICSQCLGWAENVH